MIPQNSVSMAHFPLWLEESQELLEQHEQFSKSSGVQAIEDASVNLSQETKIAVKAESRINKGRPHNLKPRSAEPEGIKNWKRKHENPHYAIKMKHYRPRRRRRRRRSHSQPPHKRPRVSTTNTLCVRCQLLFSQQGLRELNSPNGFAYYSRNDFSASINAGCTLCGLFFNLASRQFGDDWNANDSLIFRNIPSTLTTTGSSPGIEGLKGTVESSKKVITMYPFAGRGDPAAALIPRRPLRRDVQSNSVFAAARKLIHQCLRPDDPKKGHQQCRYSRDTVLPTRVVEVGSDKDPRVRLQVNKTETHGAYLALSYCWGPASETQPVQLKNNNLDALEEEIKLDDRQKSILDAITVTRKLGFKYLWVDALCIIQDNKADKDHELSKMSTIYKNATVTLAAATAEKPSQGFLGLVGSGTRPYLPDCNFEHPMENGQTGKIYLSVGGYTPPDHCLDKRGWTLQEFMLSSRMLIFSTYELLWQCEEVELQSVTGTLRGLEYQQPQESIPWTAFQDDLEPRGEISDFEKLYLWKTVICQYTNRDLTKPEDRLRAVSGITTELAKLWEDSIIYGHWQRWFVELLAWFKPHEGRVEKRFLNRAPSWSWASLDGIIHYEEPLHITDARVKVLTVAKVTLACRVLEDGDVEGDRLNSVVEIMDLHNSAAKAECNMKDEDSQYLLLGSMNAKGGSEQGVGLMILPAGNGFYRRIGLARFPEMDIWNGVRHREITFEPQKD